MSSNRREVLIAAGGIAAATSMVGSGHAVADKKAPARARLVVDIQGMGTFEAQSVQWGAGLAVSSPSGDRPHQGSNPSLSEVVISRLTDGLSPKLFAQLLRGRELDMVTITQMVGHRTVSTTVLEDVIVSGFSLSGSGGDPDLHESLSLNFVRITFGVGANQAGYDLSRDRAF